MNLQVVQHKSGKLIFFHTLFMRNKVESFKIACLKAFRFFRTKGMKTK